MSPSRERSARPTSSVNPALDRLKLHFLLRKGGFGVAEFPPEACDAAFVPSSHFCLQLPPFL
jgi:hypothetical protein